MEDFAPLPPEKKTRPTILTVFGILTFVMAGFTVLSALIGLATSALAGSDFPTIHISPIFYILPVFFAAGKVYGVIKMFKLLRVGFFVYTGCELASLATSIFQSFETMAQMEAFMDNELMSSMYGSDSAMGSIMSMSAVAGIFIGVIFSAIWIGVYAAQLKHME